MQRRHVPAENLIGAVSIDLRGAAVPGRHPSVGVQHEDGVVVDALDQQPVRLFTRGQGAHAIGHARAERQGGRRDAGHERDEQKEGVVQRGTHERSGAGLGAPHREGRQDQRDGRRVALAAPQGGPQQGQDGQEGKRRTAGRP